MVKLIVILGALFVLLWLLFGRRRGPPPPVGSAPAEPAEDMVACAHCSVNLPRSEAVQAGALTYCSRAHLVAGPRAPDKP